MNNIIINNNSVSTTSTSIPNNISASIQPSCPPPLDPFLAPNIIPNNNLSPSIIKEKEKEKKNINLQKTIIKARNLIRKGSVDKTTLIEMLNDRCGSFEIIMFRDYMETTKIKQKLKQQVHKLEAIPTSLPIINEVQSQTAGTKYFKDFGIILGFIAISCECEGLIKAYNKETKPKGKLRLGANMVALGVAESYWVTATKNRKSCIDYAIAHNKGLTKYTQSILCTAISALVAEGCLNFINKEEEETRRSTIVNGIDPSHSRLGDGVLSNTQPLSSINNNNNNSNTQPLSSINNNNNNNNNTQPLSSINNNNNNSNNNNNNNNNNNSNNESSISTINNASNTGLSVKKDSNGMLRMVSLPPVSTKTDLEFVFPSVSKHHPLLRTVQHNHTLKSISILNSLTRRVVYNISPNIN